MCLQQPMRGRDVVVSRQVVEFLALVIPTLYAIAGSSAGTSPPSLAPSFAIDSTLK